MIDWSCPAAIVAVRRHDASCPRPRRQPPGGRVRVSRALAIGINLSRHLPTLRIVIPRRDFRSGCSRRGQRLQPAGIVIGVALRIGARSAQARDFSRWLLNVSSFGHEAELYVSRRAGQSGFATLH
jgi:hypothetical protein